MTEYADPKPVIDADLLAVDGIPVADLMPQPPLYPPAVRATCACGNATAYGHGAIPDPRNPTETLPPMSCQTILEIRAGVTADLARRPSLASRLVRRVVAAVG